MWDYYSGYVHLTGLWKAIGNSKADIVKLVDNSPDLEPVIRRVRGGFLKIQGTWLPYPIARTLASRTCFHIRYALIPLFGADFPDSCLKPDEPGFGQLQLTLSEHPRKRRRRTVEGDESKRRVVRATDAESKARRDSLPLQNTLQPQKQQQPVTPYMSTLSSPPPQQESKRVKLDFLKHSSLTSSPSDFLDALQATKSLQLLSAGVIMHKPAVYQHQHSPTDSASSSAGSMSSSPCESAVADVDAVIRYGNTSEDENEFECGDYLYRWDGKQELNVVRLSSVADNPATDAVSGLLAFADRPSMSAAAAMPTPALSDGTASPSDVMIHTLSETDGGMRLFGPHPAERKIEIIEDRAENVRKVMGISKLLS